MSFFITVQKREKGDAEEVRFQGLVPGVVYGIEREPVSISVKAQELKKLHGEAGESSLIDLTVEGEKEPAKALIQDLQYDVVKGTITHVDFRQIQMNVEMNATIILHFVGESVAVKEQGGTLAEASDVVNVKCLPKDLVGSIEVDISALKTFEDSIHVKDLKLPEGIIFTDNPDSLIVKVTPPLTEEQFKAMEEKEVTSVEDVEVEGEKKEGEEGEEVAEGEKKDGKKNKIDDKKDGGKKE